MFTLCGVAAASPLAAHAQQSDRVRRIGVLMGYAESDSEAQAQIAAFRDGLQKLGWREDRNIRIDTRWARPDDADSMQRFAKELVALQPDLILSHTTPTTAALLQQTRTIPIIFANVVDPVGSGFVASLARPGGNVTGFIDNEASMVGKWLELLKEIAPRVNRVAFLFNPATATCRILPEPLQSCRSVLRHGGDCRVRSRQIRARIRRCRTDSRAEWRPDRDAGCLHDRPSR
jgi:putative ABC transport system substrate-binding protein